MFEDKLKLFPQTNLNKNLYNCKSKIKVNANNTVENSKEKNLTIGELTTADYGSVVYFYISCTQ